MGKFGEINEVLVILKDHSSDIGADANGDFDLSNKWSVIEYEDAQPQAVKITFNSRAGRFLTRAPILKKRDRIYVEIKDKNGNITKDVFHIRNIKRIRGRGKAISLQVTCPHQSENLWKSTISYRQRGRRISGNRALEIIVNDINANKGSKDPTIIIPTFDTITKTGNRFDKNTSNNYFFDAVKVDTAIQEIKEIEQQPVEGGGSFEPMYVRFVSRYVHPNNANLDFVSLQAFEQGYQNNSGNFVNIPNLTLIHPKLGSGNRPNILSLDSDEDPETGTNLIAIGDKASGSYPRDYSMYVGAQDVFNSAKSWSIGNDYKIGHLVTYLGVFYECGKDHISDNTNKPPFNIWIEHTFTKPDAWSNTKTYELSSDVVAHQDIAYKLINDNNTGNEPGISPTWWKRISYLPVVDYSPLTKNRAQYWINALAGAKHANVNDGRPQVIDPNCIIDDPLHPRTYVRFVGKNPSLMNSDHLVNGNIPHGYKALVIDPTYLALGGTGVETGEGDWSGNDQNGIPFAGNIVQYIDPEHNGTGTWVVFKGKQTTQDQEVFDWEEGLPWVKNPCTGLGAYVDGNGSCTIGSRGTQWLIGSYALSEIPLVGKFGVWVDGKQMECAHSVKWDSTNNRIDMSNEKITDIDTDGNSAIFVKSTPAWAPAVDQNTYFIGLNFWSLWPLTSNSIPHGAVTAGETNSLPTMDLDNMDLTRKLTSEWFGPLVEEYFPFQAFAGMMKLDITTGVGAGILDTFDADFTIGMWLADINDNVMVLDFPHSRNGKTLSFQGELGKLKSYKGVPGVSTFFAAEEPNPTVSFDSSNVILGGIYTKDSFDSQGRYKGVNSRFRDKIEMKLSIDAYRMIKPLVCTNVDEANNKPAVNIETLKIDKSTITSYAQLKNYILGLDKFLNFDRRAFTVEVAQGKKINFGDSVYLTDVEAINDSDDTINNTVKVVANKITLSLSKTKNGPAGIKKTVELIRRVWP